MLFNGFNSYTSLMYIAFAKGRWIFAEDKCKFGGDCMRELELEGLVIFGVQLLLVHGDLLAPRPAADERAARSPR